MFYGDFNVARRWASERFATAREYVKHSSELHAETFMQHLMQGFAIEEGRICVRVVRACGPRGIQTSDCEPAQRHPVVALTFEWRHVNHLTPVHIDMGDGGTPLLYRTRVGNGDATKMEVVVRGAVSGVAYRIVVKEVDPITGGVMMQTETVVFAGGSQQAHGQDGSSAKELVVTLVVFDTRPDTFGDRVLPRFCRGMDIDPSLSICLLPTLACGRQAGDEGDGFVTASVCSACVSSLDGMRACKSLGQSKTTATTWDTPRQ